MRGEAEVRARLEIEIWCPECAEFHDAVQDKVNKNIYSDKCGHLISVIVLGSGGGKGEKPSVVLKEILGGGGEGERRG